VDRLGRILIVALGAALFGAAPLRADGFTWEDLLPRTLQKHPKLELTVITEMSAAGRKVKPATPSAPVYYLGFDSGQSTGGEGRGGEQPPPPALLRQAMAKALAVNGYLPTDSVHPPTLFVVFKWGSFNQLSTSLYVSDQTAGMDVMDDAQRRNLIERAQIVGGSVFAEAVAKALSQSQLQHFTDSSPQNRRLLEQASDDLYYAIASAYDASAVAQGHKTLLWWTKVSCTATGLTMNEAVPALVAVVGPYFGHEMTEAKPMEIRQREGSVEIGVPTVKGYDVPGR
jgi:hypothetical protein